MNYVVIHSYLKKLKNLLLDLKAVLTTNYKAEVGAGSGAKTF
jgi:hypothetical protein